jgi:hypothetical protein
MKLVETIERCETILSKRYEDYEVPSGSCGRMWVGKTCVDETTYEGVLK